MGETPEPPGADDVAGRAGFATDIPAIGERPDTLALALELHVRAVSGGVTLSHLTTLGRAWDRALQDPNTRDGTTHRASVLGASSGSRALTELELDIRSEIAALLRKTRATLAELPDDSPILFAAANQVRQDLLAELEVAFTSLDQRVSAKRALPGIGEWREFVSLRAHYLRAIELGGMSLRRVAFPDAHQKICSLAVWLWNEREDYAIAHGMFLWLLDEAIAVGDEEAIKLQRQNTAV